MSSFVIPIIIPDILIDEGIRLDFDVNDEENKIDLVWDNIDEIILPTYKEVLNTINREDSKINCYNLFREYLEDFLSESDLQALEYWAREYENDSNTVKSAYRGFLLTEIKEYEKEQNSTSGENKA